MDGIKNVNIRQQLEMMGHRSKGSISSGAELNTKEKSTQGIDTGFANSLKEAIGKVNEIQKVSDQKIEDLATGKSTNLHDTMIAVEKADIAMKLMVQVRNKIIDAYQEIMKMQV